MDFIEGLSKAGGFDSIIVVVNRLSKMTHSITLKHPFTVKQVAKKFVEEIISKQGIPNSIVTDCDKIFLSHFWKELFEAMGTSLKRNTTFHPQTNGHTERERDLVISAFKENLLTTQNNMKKQVDLHRREMKFKVEDEVYLKLQPWTKHIQHLPPALTEEFELQVEPEVVLGVRLNNEIGANYWLVKWKLEDKVSFEPDGILDFLSYIPTGASVKKGMPKKTTQPIEINERNIGEVPTKGMYIFKEYFY
ncbi:Retrotransposable element Tf2 [Cucumis melo var. makuwa]|uniref:Retrotransposable element Tf2 n=1 Tax=Cucumis melo var. makuwa TaxID=1194695 RepID=A0A5A7U722_CUCMM|nr:Retrotransposable element Tf2 [Cucumis melo var. makuwa]TYK07707.1 Retrotransposable element Tf2 [Cucumis melo var. makuwa]